MDEQELTPETEADQDLPERHEPAPRKQWAPPFSPNLLRRNPPRPQRVRPGFEAQAGRPRPARLAAPGRPRRRPAPPQG